MLEFINEQRVINFRATYIGDGTVAMPITFVFTFDEQGCYQLGIPDYPFENEKISSGTVNLPITREEVKCIIQGWIDTHPQEGINAVAIMHML